MKTARWRTGISGGISLFLILMPLTRAQALVNTADIVNLAVTTPKIGNLAVTNAKLGTAAVTSTKIAPKAVTADKLGAAAVTSAKIALRAVTADKVAFYNHVIVVAPSGGNFTSPVAAMNAITDASETNPYLVKIMPGVYDIGGGTVQMKPWVSIEGSGPGITSIVGTQNTCEVDPDYPGNMRPRYGVVTGSSNAILGSLSVRNNGASTEACDVVAILASDCDGMGIGEVGAQARGSNRNVGILVRISIDLEPVWIANSQTYAEDGVKNIGILLQGHTAATSDQVNLAAVLSNTVASANGVGVHIANTMGIISGGIASAEQAVIIEGGSAAIQGALLMGSVDVNNNSERPFTSVIANSTDLEGTLTVNNGTLSVTNSSLAALSVSLLNNPTLTLLNSSVDGVTMASGTFKAASSSLGGPATVTGGSATCAATVQTNTFAMLDGACQSPP